MRLRTLGLLVAVPVGLLLGASGVRADSIDPGSTISELYLGGGIYQYSINMNLSSNSSFVSGDEFTILDIAGLQLSGATAPAGWTVAYEAQALSTNLDDAHLAAAGGGTFLPLGSIDTSGLNNVLFVWTGGTVSGPQALGTFTFESTTQFADGTLFEGSSSYLNDATGALQQANTFSDTVAVPLPNAAVMGLSTLVGLAGLGLLRRRRLV